MELLILDVDGVLARYDEPVSPEVSEILNKISKRVKVVFASGKSAPYLEGLARGTSLHNVAIIGENGGVIYFPEKMEEIVFSDLYPEVKEELMVLRKELDKRLNNKCWFQSNKVVVTAFPKPNFTVETIEREYKEVIKEHKLKNVKLLVHADAVDGIPKGLDKGWAVDKLSETLNISKSKFIAVGDSDSDIPMLNKTGLSICIGNNPNVERVTDKAFKTGIEAFNYILKVV
jgi:HAD superfamily hydrolase (TIGR01484 family)